MILAKDLFPPVALVTIQTGPDQLHVCPFRIFPIATQHKFVLLWVKTEADVAVVQKSQMCQKRGIILIVIERKAFLSPEAEDS